MTAQPYTQPDLFVVDPTRKRTVDRGQFKAIHQYFLAHPNEIVTIRALETALKLTHTKALAGVSYWRRDYPDTAPIVIQYGKKWKYVPPVAAPAPAPIDEDAIRAVMQKMMIDSPPPPPAVSPEDQEARDWINEGIAMAKKAARREAYDELLAAVLIANPSIEGLIAHLRRLADSP